MSHASEGELHAWLDGAAEALEQARREALAAHLSGCPDCRARLARERTIRDRADELLAEAELEASPPPFERVLSEARAQGAGTGGKGAVGGGFGGEGPRRAVPLAWAASVVLAVAAGWLLRSAAIDPATGAGEPARVATVTDAREVGEREAALRSEERPAAEARARAAPAEAEAVRPEVETEADAANLADEAPGPGAPTAGAPAVPERVAVEGAVAERSAGEGSGPVWVAATASEAARWLGGTPYRVTGLPVAGVAVSSRGEARLVRVRHLLPGGGWLSLVQEASPSGAAAADTPPGRFPAEEGVAIRGPGGVRLSATASEALTADSLRTLLGRLAPLTEM